MPTARLLPVYLLILTALNVNLSAQALDFDETKKLADAGNPIGQNNLGVMYERGNGVPKDYDEALK